MSTLAIPISQDYIYHVSVLDVPLADCKFIQVESQWLGSKEPEARQKKLLMTLTKEQLKQLANHLLESAK